MEQSGADQYRWVRGISATGDGGYGNKSVADVGAGAILEVDLHFWIRSAGDEVQEILLHVGEIESVLRSLGTGERGDDLCQIQLDDFGELGILCGVGAEKALLFAVRFHQID